MDEYLFPDDDTIIENKCDSLVEKPIEAVSQKPIPVFKSLNNNIDDRIIVDHLTCFHPIIPENTRFYRLSDIIENLSFLKGNFFSNFYEYIPKFSNFSCGALFEVPYKIIREKNWHWLFGESEEIKKHYLNHFMPRILPTNYAIRNMAKISKKIIVSMNPNEYTFLDEARIPFYKYYKHGFIKTIATKSLNNYSLDI